jgi:septal ring factor EnvC (AmiA/AmiB activator)
VKRAALLLAALTLAPTGGAAPADPVRDLGAAARALAEARTPGDQLAALGAAIAAEESELANLRAELRALALRRDPLIAALGAQDGAAFATLAALDRLGRAPPMAFLVHPGGPVAAIRAAIALGDAAPALHAQATRTRAALDALAALEGERAVTIARLRGALARFQDTRADIARALTRHRDALPPALQAAVQGAASDLEAAIAMLPAETLPDDPAAPGFAEVRGLIPLPVAGTIAQRFGAQGPQGERPGLWLRAPAYATVRAPWLSTLRFAGEVGDLGQVAVLEPEPGTLIVLAGLARVDRAVGEVLLAGEPLGSLGGPPPRVEDFLIETGTEDGTLPSETLYMELRRDGVPVDPEPWFAFAVERTNG